MSFDPQSLLPILDRTRPRFLEAGRTVNEDSGNASTQLEGDESDGDQYVDGFLALVREAAVGQGDDVRSFYLSTALPPLVSSGFMTADDVVRVTAGWGFMAIRIVLPEVPEEDREEAHRWLVKFFAGYVADVARVCYPG